MIAQPFRPIKYSYEEKKTAEIGDTGQAERLMEAKRRHQSVPKSHTGNHDEDKLEEIEAKVRILNLCEETVEKNEEDTTNIKKIIEDELLTEKYYVPGCYSACDNITNSRLSETLKRSKINFRVESQERIEIYRLSSTETLKSEDNNFNVTPSKSS